LSGAMAKAFNPWKKALEYDVTSRLKEPRHGRAEAVTWICPLTSSQLGNEEEVLEAPAIDPGGPTDALRLAHEARAAEAA